jgi:hypothetical protein
MRFDQLTVDATVSLVFAAVILMNSLVAPRQPVWLPCTLPQHYEVRTEGLFIR